MKFLKKYFLLFIIHFGYSQSVPELINYQGLARDASGQPLINQPVNVSFTIWQGSPGSNNVFSETHSKNTNNFGLFDLKIGNINKPAFQNIDWSNGPYFLEVAINGVSMGSQQMVSVPYALFAKSSSPQTLSIVGNTLSIQGGNSVTLPAGQTPSITGLGIATVTPLSGFSFQVHVPPPTLSISTSAGNSSLLINQGSSNTFVVLPNPTVNAWGLTGNAGTNPTLHFMGTSDNIPLHFKAGGGYLMKLYHAPTSTTGILGLGNASNPSFTPQSVAHFISTNSSYRSLLRLGNPAEPNREWHFDVDSISRLHIMNENTGIPFSAITIWNDGRIGIGTTSPQHLVHVSTNNTYTNNGLYLTHNGSSGNGLFIHSSNTLNTNAALNINYVHGGIGLNILSTNSLNTNPNLNIDHQVGGFGINVISSSTNDAINVNKNSNSGRGMVINMLNLSQGNALQINHSGNSNHGIHINKSGTNGHGISVLHSGANGSAIYVDKTGNTGNGIYVNSSTNNSSSLYSVKTGSIGGSAEFVVTHSLNNSYAIESKIISGTGDAILAEVHTATNSARNSIVLNNGHIKSTSSIPPTFTPFAVSPFNTPTIASSSTVGCTDVKGSITFSISSASVVSNTISSTGINVSFQKTYSNPPVVILTPMSNLLTLIYRVENVTTTGFQIRLSFPSNGILANPIPSTEVKFSYFVIE